MDNYIIIIMFTVLTLVLIKYILQAWLVTYTMKKAKNNQVSAMVRLADWLYQGRFVKQNKELSLQYYIKAAEWGDRRSQYNAGKMYDLGEGIERNYTQAKHYFTLAAGQNYPAAISSLGVYYYQGKGIHQNYDQAFFYFQQAAKDNFPEALYNLAIMYAKGEGVTRDLNQARQLLKQLPDSYFLDPKKSEFRRAINQKHNQI